MYIVYSTYGFIRVHVYYVGGALVAATCAYRCTVLLYLWLYAALDVVVG